MGTQRNAGGLWGSQNIPQATVSAFILPFHYVSGLHMPPASQRAQGHTGVQVAKVNKRIDVSNHMLN